MATITKSVARKALGEFHRERKARTIGAYTGECYCNVCVESMKVAVEKVLDEVNKGWGYHRPVCAKCQVEMRPERNGVGLLDMADYGPVQIWDADLWQCPKCGYEIVAGFGQRPISYHYKGEEFNRFVNGYREHSLVIKSRC